MLEEPLLERIQAGDQEAFRQLYDHYAPMIYRYALARVSNAQDAEDLAAETFVKAWQAFSHFKWRGAPIGAWLFRITHNLIVDKYRQRRDLLDWLPWLQHSAEDAQLSQIDQQDEIKRALRSLSYEQQVILQLHFFEDHSHEDIAKFLGKSANAVRVAQFRALQRLHEVLENVRPK